MFHCVDYYQPHEPFSDVWNSTMHPRYSQHVWSSGWIKWRCTTRCVLDHDVKNWQRQIIPQQAIITFWDTGGRLSSMILSFIKGREWWALQRCDSSWWWNYLYSHSGDCAMKHTHMRTHSPIQSAIAHAVSAISGTHSRPPTYLFFELAEMLWEIYNPVYLFFDPTDSDVQKHFAY